MNANPPTADSQGARERLQRIAQLQQQLADGPVAELIALLAEELRDARTQQIALEKEINDLQIELQLRGVFRQSCCD